MSVKTKIGPIDYIDGQIVLGDERKFFLVWLGMVSSGYSLILWGFYGENLSKFNRLIPLFSKSKYLFFLEFTKHSCSPKFEVGMFFNLRRRLPFTNRSGNAQKL
jgi:hypothetical protein